jgi:CRP-like cAMP-binding protein
MARGTLGYLDFLARRPHRADAVARSEVRALVVHGEDLLDVLEENVDFAHVAITKATTRLFVLQTELAPSGGFPQVEREVVSPDAGHLTMVDRILALRKTGAFAGAHVHSVGILAFLAEEVVLSPGEVLRRQGDPARSLFVVARGSLRAERTSPALDVRFGPGSIVGGVAALGWGEHAFTTVAESPAVLLRLHHEVLFDLLTEHADLLRAVLAELATERDRLLRWKARRPGASTGNLTLR